MQAVAGPPPPPAVTVSVSPSTASVILGNSQTFTASVANASDTSVSWSVNGIPGGNAVLGTVTAGGLYTAPPDLPVATSVQVSAVSHADARKSAAAEVAITSDITVSVAASAAAINLGATQAFRAVVQSNGHPDTSVRWSLAGAACPSGCGSIDAFGNFTAPQVLPSASNVTLTAQSVADPSKASTAAVTITSGFSLQISAPSSIAAGSSAMVAATLTAAAGSNPSPTLSWSLSGSGCNGTACGTLTIVTTQSLGGNTTADTAVYTAPPAVPTPNVVTIVVTPLADPSKKSQASVTIQPGTGVSLSPPTATLAANHRITLTAQVSGATNTNVTWTVNGITGGSPSVGQLCVVASNPCQQIAGNSGLQADYLAPGAPPSADPVTVQATSVADPTKGATSHITVINHVLITIQPTSVGLMALTTQNFVASVLGTTNQGVTWQVQGGGCPAPGSCGSISQSGLYTAPAGPPSPDQIQIIAISVDDPSESGSAIVTIQSGANILAIHPASVYAGSANGFVLRVDGSGFSAASGGRSSILLIAGTSRTTTCNSSIECTTPVTAADVASAGNVSVQLQNPDGTRSNSVALVVAPPNSSDEMISLSSGTPVVNGKDIVVVDPTTAGVSLPGADLDLKIAALGAFAVSNSSCTLAGNPLPLQRTATGSTTAEICLFSEGGLDTSMTYTVSGPGDITVIAKQSAGLGIIHLTLQIPSSAAPCARTLFIQNANLDKTAASGALEVY